MSAKEEKKPKAPEKRHHPVIAEAIGEDGKPHRLIINEDGTVECGDLKAFLAAAERTMNAMAAAKHKTPLAATAPLALGRLAARAELGKKK